VTERIPYKLCSIVKLHLQSSHSMLVCNRPCFDFTSLQLLWYGSVWVAC